MVMFSANQYPDGRRKDTVLNAEETDWFVWNMATYDLREEVNKSAQVLDYGDSEWDRLSVTKEYADLSLIHISEPTRPCGTSRMPSSA